MPYAKIRHGLRREGRGYLPAPAPLLEPFDSPDESDPIFEMLRGEERRAVAELASRVWEERV